MFSKINTLTIRQVYKHESTEKFQFTSKMEHAVSQQRAIIFFLWKEGTSSSNIAERLAAVFGDEALKRSTVYEWVARFKGGRTSLEDDPRPGRPVSSLTNDNVAKVKDCVLQDRRSTIREISEAVGLNVFTVHQIIHDELDMRKLTARWVPRLLNQEQKTKRFEMSRALLERVDREGEQFFSRLITMDESWLPYFMPETKLQSRMWCARGDPPPLKAKTLPSCQKVMISVFWDEDGLILVDYLPKGSTINSQYFCKLVNDDLRQHLKNRRRGKLSMKPILQMDNATPHTAAVTKDLLAKLGWDVLPHPPYSPDLAPSDFHLFPRLKEPLRGKRFHSLDEMKEAVESWRQRTPKEFYQSGLRSLVSRWKKCVASGGDYIEKLRDDSE